ncbi:recombinase family protein [Paraburkholderia sabiae]|uniref:Recombinase family protein n=1 Tax=Paraburkholderia sabiae TaxID=273251 RepID=A0ABU9QR56_9BURK|nr:recombinase family protein [Paraburkholderia sabiae]
MLRNALYAGAYAYGKSGSQTTIVDGRAHKTYRHRKPFDQWEVLLKEHHEGYIDWGAFERNQTRTGGAVHLLRRAQNEERYLALFEVRQVSSVAGSVI